ncbi:hypothetical protein JRQ81_012747 [Phrynocephalus forsythii]|uniref:Uncharacterized protein n=1 Tax=Phrynocephalus forsythii TaxID=171643 RepID=A0A9Q0Y1Q3_9SAUR|nr:hypothetical protein JRQ81_012747 [Phrynocephalus forsythii]
MILANQDEQINLIQNASQTPHNGKRAGAPTLERILHYQYAQKVLGTLPSTPPTCISDSHNCAS